MINFLRKLRSKSMKKGDYVKYALGEIILVVIGILIAVSINNWNEARRERIKENQLLSKLKTENEYNTASLINDSSYHSKVDWIPYQLQKALRDERSAKNDSIILLKLLEIRRSTIFTFSSKYLERYIENSAMDSDELVDELVELREYQNNLRQVSQMAFDFKFEKIFTYLEDFYDVNTESVTDIEELRTLRFINRLITLENLEEAQVDIYLDCIQQHLKLDSLLAQRLSR